MSRALRWAGWLCSMVTVGLSLLSTLRPDVTASSAPPVWGGCAAVLQGPAPICVYRPDAPVRVWVEHPNADESRVLVDGTEVEIERYTLPHEPHGRGLRIMIPAGASTLEIRVPGVDHGLVWTLALRDEVLEAADPGEELPRAWGSGDGAQMRAAAVRMAERLVDEGRVSDAVFALSATSYMLGRDFEDAASLLDHAEAIGATFPEGHYTAAIYRGRLSWALGELHAAAALLRDGARYALRVEDDALARDAIPAYAEALARLGYYEEAVHWSREALARLPSSNGCNRAAVLRTIGWIQLVLRARDQPADDPRPLLDEAIEVYRHQAQCAHKRAGAHLSLALLAFDEGDVAESERRLAMIEHDELSIEDRVRAADLRVRLRLAARAEAPLLLQAWDELERAAEDVDGDDAPWRLEVRRGEILEQRGDLPAAQEWFERAEQRLERLVRTQAVLGVGRAATADRYFDGTVGLVSVLVAQGKASEALCVARQARARRRSAAAGLDTLPAGQQATLQETIRRYREAKQLAEQLEARAANEPKDIRNALHQQARAASREAARLADEIAEPLAKAARSPRCSELVPPAPAELLVGLFPRSDDWLVFTATREATVVHTVQTPTAIQLADPRQLGEHLLDPISQALDAASSVRVLAEREAESIDLQRLPWRGRSLLSQRPVTHGVELPARPEPERPAPPRALLLGDVTDTLIFAEAEAESVASVLTAAGWATSRAATDATGALALDFAGVAWLHYVGHTRGDEERTMWAPYTAGEAGGLPQLVLGPTARIAAHDLLLRRPVPPTAFLAGCQTGVAGIDTGSTSLALAFLIADGHRVIASREDLADDLAVLVARRFYAHLVDEARGDAAVAMHLVQQDLEDAGHVVPYWVWVR